MWMLAACAGAVASQLAHVIAMGRTQTKAKTATAIALTIQIWMVFAMNSK
jgi:hypothetical protein